MDEELKKAAYLGLNLVDFEDHFRQEYATMQEVTTTTVSFPSTSRDVLSEVLRQGAQAMLTTAIEAEVAEWIDQHQHLKDERGHRQVVRNGYLPERKGKGDAAAV